MSHLLTSEPGWGGCTLLSQKIDLEVFANQVLQTAAAENRVEVCLRILQTMCYRLLLQKIGSKVLF